MTKRKNNMNMLVIAGGLFIVIVLIGSVGLSGNLLTGYGGMTAEIVRVQDGYGLYDAENFADNTRILGTTASVDVAWNGYIFSPDPTGVRMEITSRLRPVEDAAINLGTVERPTYDSEGIENGNERIVARIVPMMMGVTVRTFGVGKDAVRGIEFIIRIQENDFNMFENADETIAYLVDVYLIDSIKTTSSQLMQLDPSSGGVSVPSVAKGTNPVPSWVTEGSNLIDYNIPATHSIVESTFTVVTAEPNMPLFAPREENEATWNVGVDVLVFGHWVVQGELPNFDPQDAPSVWDDFLMAVNGFIGAVGAMIFGVIIIVALIFIFLILRTFKGGKQSEDEAAFAKWKRGKAGSKSGRV